MEFIEALNELATRIGLGKVELDEAGGVMLLFDGECGISGDIPSAHEKDITARNLAVLAEVSSQSADKTVQDVSAHYGPDAMGPAYSQELADSIEKVKVGGPDGNPINATKSNTLEAQFLNAADSLDIGRTAEFDPAYFDFLRDKNGHVSPEAKKIRDQLIAEADLLQRLTNPICATKQVTNHLTQLQLDSPDQEFVMQLQQQKDDLDAENAENLIYETEHVDDGPYFDKIEDAIRSHPDLFPLFTKYYLDAA